MTRTFSLALLLATTWLSSSSLHAADQTGTASVTVTVPVGATLTINGHPTAQMTAVRSFVTPQLALGKKYRYIFEATFTWNGDEVVKRKQLDLTVGTSYSVDMMQGETVKKPAVVEEPEVPVVPKKPDPKPTPNKVEPRNPAPPRPAPRTEQSNPPARITPPPATTDTNPRPNPEPPKPADPKPSAVIAEPQRPLAPKPREVKPKL